jgi:hypothetical protein
LFVEQTNHYDINQWNVTSNQQRCRITKKMLVEETEISHKWLEWGQKLQAIAQNGLIPQSR